MLATAVAALLTLRAVSGARTPSRLQQSLLADRFLADDDAPSRNVSACAGYAVTSLQDTETGLLASLSLAGPACNAFGRDVQNLTLAVTYDSQSRLHVNIYDTAQSQFTIPASVVELAKPTGDSSLKNSSDLVFNYDSSPFAFWITRRSEPDGQPLFDTRTSSLPPTPIPAIIPDDNSTALDGFPLVFEDQYLQLTSALPLGANIYGLGEIVASSGFRRDVGTDGNGTIQTMWARDAGDPIDENIYGSHPFYVEHRYNESTNSSSSHGVFLFSSAGSDILLLSPPSSPVSLVEYRLIGGTLDFYFFSGPNPQRVIEQYGELVGLPAWQPAWGFGFQLCRWGYKNVNETREQVTKMREANIPLEVMWNDIDVYQSVRDFTTDPVSFPAEEMRAFIAELREKNQRYIPIVDAAIPKPVNATDVYLPYEKGTELDVFIKNPDGSEYVGQVWPGFTVFPDWFAKDASAFWAEALRNWSQSGLEFSGIWLDMNEASSFCIGSCGSGSNATEAQIPYDYFPTVVPPNWPEGYNGSVWGISGNMTINGTSTFGNNVGPINSLNRRGDGAGHQTGVDLNTPPYAIHNGDGLMAAHTISTNATHAGGLVELDVHNMWGLMEEKATYAALLDLHPGKRPFIISRSTFASSGKYTGHWLGDNFSKWQYLYFNIQGALQFQLFQIPFVGADTCGFQGNTDEELCNRWMQLSAFMPFFRNHNVMMAISQEPYRWDSVAAASRDAIAVRYSMMPYWYTLFANSSMRGTPPVRALFFEFPDERELFGVDAQFLIGRDILVTPVVTPNATTVDGIFPGRGSVVWRDWYTHAAVNATPGANTTLDAPLGHINVHVRDGSAILLHDKPAYTITETREGPFALLVSLSKDGSAFGTAYLDDGESLPPTPNRTVTFTAANGSLTFSSTGDFKVEQRLQRITILGVSSAYPPAAVKIAGAAVEGFEFDAALEKLVISNVSLALDAAGVVSWSA